MASHLKRKQATKGPDFGSRGTKSLKDLKVGKKKKRTSKSSPAKQGWLPWHSATVGAEGRGRDVDLRDKTMDFNPSLGTWFSPRLNLPSAIPIDTFVHGLTPVHQLSLGSNC